jgi:acyl-CoA thioester hydrolase
METHRAVVFPWHCDHMGHMNVRWYAHAFDDAGFHMWSQIGLSHATLGKRGLGTVIARTETEFKHEASAGELLVVRSAFTRLGTKSLTMSQRMTNAETGVLCAAQDAVEVFFDLKARAAVPIPDDIRAKLEPVLAKAG